MTAPAPENLLQGLYALLNDFAEFRRTRPDASAALVDVHGEQYGWYGLITVDPYLARKLAAIVQAVLDEETRAEAEQKGAVN